MVKRLLTMVLLLTGTITLLAQNRTITGTLYDGELKEKVPYAIVQLLKQDSSYVVGATSDEVGNFKITAPTNGRFILKASYVGYKTIFQNLTIINEQDLSLGQLDFQIDARTLKEVKVVASTPKVIVKADTFQYNASAYRVPEGSTIEALVKRLPGAEVASDGTIKINGKEVKKILVDGKEFMVGDTKTAMKNLPTSIVQTIKAYDQKSDLSRVTGIDDGNESTVLDFGIKAGMNKGLFSNIDFGIATQNRYSEKAMGAYFNNKFRMMGFASANNVNDMGFGGGPRGRFGGVRQGLNATKMVGLNMNYDNGKNLQWDGSLRWNHADGDLNTRMTNENFVAQQTSFANRLAQEHTRTNSWNGRFRLEWRPDSMWNIMFRPNFRLSKNDGQVVSTSAAYNADPYNSVEEPLSTTAIAQLKSRGLIVNSQHNMTISYGNTTSLGAILQVNRKLSSNGRNVTLRVDGNYNDANSKTFSTQDILYFQLQDALGNDSTYRAYRYNLMPTKSWDYALQTTYSEPIAHKTYLQFSYEFKYGFSKSDRDTYDLSTMPSGTFGSLQPAYRSWNNYLDLLTNPLVNYLDDNLSRYSEYRTYTHDMQVMMRMIRDKWKMNVGVMLQPQHATYMQNYLNTHVDTARTIFNWSPTLDFRYKFNEQSNLRINYKGTLSQPAMTQLLSIVDNTDPQNIAIGNPGLKPAFTNNFSLFYNTYKQSHAQTLMTFANFSTTRNAIGNRVTYDAITGARIVQPINVNGNWNADAGLMYNTSIDSAGVWNIHSFSRANFNRYVSYLQPNRTSDLKQNITKSLTLSERLAASYRSSWLELEIDGSFDHTRTKNNLQNVNNLRTWQFAYGGTLNLNLPWNMSISTDLHQNSRRGYSDASLNANELLWNAQIAQSMLTGKALTLSLQFYDILRQQSNLSRVINAVSRTDTEYNSINSYIMLRATYRLNLFGGKNAMPKPKDHPDFDHNGPEMGPRPSNRSPHSGNARPPMGGGFGGF